MVNEHEPIRALRENFRIPYNYIVKDVHSRNHVCVGKNGDVYKIIISYHDLY